MLALHGLGGSGAGTHRRLRLYRCWGSAPFPWLCWRVERLWGSVGNRAGRWVLHWGVFNRLRSLLSVLGLRQLAVHSTVGQGCGDRSYASRGCHCQQRPWGQALSDGAMNRQSVVVNVKQHAGRAAPAPQAQQWARD